MLRSSLLAASAVILCTAASAQQNVGAKKVLGPVRDAGIYHVATGTWTRGGGQSNISPGCVYRNDAGSGYFGTGWENCMGTDEIILPGTGNPKGGTLDAYTIDGFSFAYCKNGGGTCTWSFRFFDAYVPCDDPDSNVSCINDTNQDLTFSGLPGGSACWILTVDLAGGYELCLEADGGTCSPGYDGGINSNLDHGGIGATFNGGGQLTGPILNGNPNWNPRGGNTCWNPADSCTGGKIPTGSTGLGSLDLFAISAGGCGLSPGCYFFGGYKNTNGCEAASQTPLAQFNYCLFSDCSTACTPGTGCQTFFIDCDETTNSNNVADISLDNCSIGSGGPGNLGMVNAPLNQFCYPLIGAGDVIVQNPPGAKGALCLGGMAIGRYNMDIQNTGGTGTANVDISNSVSGGPNWGIPAGIGGNIVAGQTWGFQYWHRQPNMQPASFSSRIKVTFTN